MYLDVCFPTHPVMVPSSILVQSECIKWIFSENVKENVNLRESLIKKYNKNLSTAFIWKCFGSSQKNHFKCSYTMNPLQIELCHQKQNLLNLNVYSLILLTFKKSDLFQNDFVQKR